MIQQQPLFLQLLSRNNRYTELLEFAQKVAALIYSKNGTRINNHYCSSNINIEDILIFGSVARGKQNPNDVDILILQNCDVPDFLIAEYDSDEDSYGLYNYLVHFLRIESNKSMFVSSTRSNIKVLHKEKFFTDTQYRSKCINKESDPHFYRNAFSNVMKYDPSTKRFFKTSLEAIVESVPTGNTIMWN